MADTDLTEEQQRLRDDAQATFRRVQFALQMKHPDQALRMLTPLLERLQKSAQEEPDCLPDRLDFTDPAQAYLYLSAHPDVDPEDVKPTVAPYTDAYGIHSALLYALGRYEDAAAAIDNALRFNTADAGLYLERAMSHEAMGDFDAVEKDIEAAWPLIIIATDLARYHAFRANVLVTQGKYELAAAHYAVYEDFDPDDVYADPHAELHELAHASGRGHKLAHLSAAEAAQRLKRAGENYGPSKLAVDTMQELLNDTLNAGKFDDARYVVAGLWAITRFDGWKTLLDKLDELAGLSEDERRDRANAFLATAAEGAEDAAGAEGAEGEKDGDANA